MDFGNNPHFAPSNPLQQLQLATQQPAAQLAAYSQAPAAAHANSAAPA